MESKGRGRDEGGGEEAPPFESRWESRPTVRERLADRCLRGAFRGERCERRSRGPGGPRRAPPFLPPPPQRPRAIREPGFKADAREPTEAGREAVGRRGRSLPLVGGGVPGPRQPRAPHRLVAEGAIVVDAAHPPHGRGALEGSRPERARGAGAARGEASGGRAEAGNSRRPIRGCAARPRAFPRGI